MSFAKRKITLSRLIIIGLVIGASVLTARAANLIGLVVMEESAGARREIQTDVEIKQPTISFIDSPSASCYRAVPNTGQCYIQWSYLYVSASTSQYVISMTVEIDSRLRAYHAGFFQTYMYIPSEMHGDGFQVTCGKPGTDGFGNAYTYTLRARETGGLSAANYGSVTCPGDLAKVFMPIVSKH
jgi:hypothetical protein